MLQATIFIGFLQSGCQLLLQTTLLIRFWDNFNGVLIQYGTLLSPQCELAGVESININSIQWTLDRDNLQNCDCRH